jgi:hypothetical protein
MGSIIIEIEDRKRTPKKGEMHIRIGFSKVGDDTIEINPHDWQGADFPVVIVKRILEKKSTGQEAAEDYTDGIMHPYQWMGEENGLNTNTKRKA